MDRILFGKRPSNAGRDDTADELWLGAEAMVAPGCLRNVTEPVQAAATERDVDPSWCVV